MDILFLVGRILFGGYFVLSGINHLKYSEMMAGYAGAKGVPMPKAAVIGSGLWIIVAGLGIILGVYPQIAIAMLAIFLVVVTFWMHRFWSIEDSNIKMTEMISFMKNTALLGADLMFLAISEPWILSWMI